MRYHESRPYMITSNDALQFIKDHHNGEIPYTFGKNEYARWMAEFANYTVTKHLYKLVVSGKQPTEFSTEAVIESIKTLWKKEFGSLRDDSIERDGYFVCGFVHEALKAAGVCSGLDKTT